MTTNARELAELATAYAGGNGLSFRNRIINGDMRIDQRNAGASVTPINAQYSVDRWRAALSQASKYSIQQNAGAVTPPAGFTNYLGVTSLSAYSVGASDFFDVRQIIEGFNIADLGWGTASAQAVTLSFWVRSSLTGTFGGALKNNAADRSYPFTYSISAANTWEQKTVVVPGDTSGTWLTTNSGGIILQFGLGVGATFSGTAGSWQAANLLSATGAVSVVGTNAATFFITGVQLEAGSVATPFERRPYGTELALCQRYYYRIDGPNASPFGHAFATSTTAARGVIPFMTPMRISPTALEVTGTAADYSLFYDGAITRNCSAVPNHGASSQYAAQLAFTVSEGLAVGKFVQLRNQSGTAFLAWSAEL